MDTKTDTSVRPQGGWITFPFVAGTMLGLGISFSGAISNMIVYLIKEFNTNSVDAAQIYNIIVGCTTLAPVVGAIVSDAFFGCFPVVAFSTFINFLSLILFTLTATIPSLRGSTAGFAVLYLAVALLAIGTGGTHFNMLTMGADQYDKAKDQETFINWYMITLYLSVIIGATVILYVQDNLSWGLGFGLCAAASAAAMVVLLVGSRYYRRQKAKGSPVTGLARVVVASIRKRKADRLGKEGMEYYYGSGEREEFTQNPTHGFRFLNRAALISEGDKNTDGSVAKPWNLCSVEQVEDLKILLRIFPLLTTAIFLNVNIAGQDSLTVLQALTVDRTIGPHFTVPAGSMNVSTQVTAAIFISFLDRILMPSFRKLTNRSLTPLQRIGIGHLVNILAMAASAIIERRRAMIVHVHNATEESGWIVPMSVTWLLPNAVTGIGQALHFPGFVSFLYREFPKSFSSTATAMVAMLIACAYYTSTGIVGIVRRRTNWLPDNINASRLDKVYWMFTVVGAVNFGYFLLCSMLYRYNNRETREEEVDFDTKEFVTNNSHV